MKKQLLFAFVIIAFVQQGFSWGDEGHKLIGRQSVKHLNLNQTTMKEYGEYLNLHSPDPDYRKDKDKTEGTKHYVDVDFYKEFLSGKMITDREELNKIYGDTTVTKMGVLPWATIDTYKKLVQAIKEDNKEKILYYMADLSHYVGDGHQPMHAIINYNGQLSGQKGIHGRYEIEMFDRNLKEVEDSFSKKEIKPVENLTEFIFSYINYSNFISPVVFESDKIARQIAGSTDNDLYYQIMWFRTGKITKEVVNDASYHLAQLYLTAWIEAGKELK